MNYLASHWTAAWPVLIACYLGAGVLFWLQLIGSRPSSPAAAPLRRLRLLVGAVVADKLHFAVAAMALLSTWLDDEERDDPTRDLDRLTRRWTVGWPSLSGAGAAAWQPGPRYRRPTP